MKNVELERHALNIRKYILTQVHAAQSGHPGGSLSSTDIVTALYLDEMDINADNLGSIDRDRFVLSKGHASPLLYAVLCEKGFLPEEELTTFRHLNSRLQGHPSMRLVAGADIAAFINIGHAANADQTFNQIAAIQLFADQIIHLFPP